MAIIIGDIHGSINKAEAFLGYRPHAEHIALGDLVDSRDVRVTFDEELACLDLLLASDAVLLWGNHDLAYLEHAPWSIADRNPGEFHELQKRYQQAFEERRLMAAYSVNDWLMTHAGISTALAAGLSAAGAPFDGGDTIAVAKWLNAEFGRQILKPAGSHHHRYYGVGPLFQIGGDDQYGGMFWFNPRWEPAHPPEPRIKQLFAHTQVEGPLKKSTYINIHIDDGLGYWVFDTAADGFVLLRKSEEEEEK